MNFEFLVRAEFELISEKYYDNGIGNATEKSTDPQKKDMQRDYKAGPEKKGSPRCHFKARVTPARGDRFGCGRERERREWIEEEEEEEAEEERTRSLISSFLGKCRNEKSERLREYRATVA